MTKRLYEVVSPDMSRTTAEREQLMAAVTHDAWAIARTGTTANADWRAAVRHIADASARLDQLDQSEENE
jgi:hypothetical protein